jgi:carbon monoxide dehydrogenase subunit G
MMVASTTVDIRATPRRVWAVLADIEGWPDWTPTVKSIERLDSGPLAVGTRARIRQPRLPPAEWRITSVDKGRGFTWVTRSPGVSVTAHHFVEPTPEGSRVTLSIQFGGLLGPLVGWLTRRQNDRYLGLEAAGLKRRSEERG